MSDFLKGLVEVKNDAKRVSDSAIARHKRILDAKRRMAVKRDGTASSINRVSDSARPSTRGMVKRTLAVQGLTRKQDSASKSYMRLRQRIKDELAETETTEEAIEAAVNVLSEEVENAPAEVLNAAEDIISAVVEVVGDLLPEGGEGEPEGDADADADFEPEADDEVADSARRAIVRRRGVADARKLAMIRRRVKDGLARRRALAVKDNVRPSVRRSAVRDSEARRRALAAARRVRDARARRAAVRPSRRAADSRMSRRVVRRG